MAQCKTCVSGIGVVTVINLENPVSVRTAECPECEGTGQFSCSGCGRNPADLDCRCDLEE